ncbi:hypothetical protein WSS15_23950 [Acetobacter pasteurianus]|uniref:SGNH/GDSL hydrolase family protein n=1 Tax=Acetobacter pasteurianus TaxID=438 RepID=UPI0022C1CFCF|nr:SGNH/GDSL hydrolase family protein [Acetobacter pasteurianus]GLH29745.1 hypothetical protein WSS15_23950 [Acetobacter pasteurianus]
MSGTTQSGTPITALPVATAVAATDNVLGVVKNTDGTQEAQQVPVEVIGAAVSEAAGISAAVQAAQNAATTAQAASDASYKNATQAVNDKIGVANGAAALDSKAQLLLQGESSLAITPATAASGTTPATPAKLKPLLPLDETATVGNAGNTLGDAVSQAAGAVQAAGGDASSTVVTPESGSNSVTLGRLSGSRRNFAAYGSTSDGSATGTALAAIATKLNPIGKTSVVIPSGDDFSLGYDQVQAQNAGMGIFLSDAPENTGTNKRRQAVNPAWGSPYMFGPTVHASDLPNFTAACNAGSATVMIMGDSIFNAGANLANPQQCPWEELLTVLEKANPNVTFTDYNMTWGAQNWAQMADTSNGSSVPKWIYGYDGTTSWLDLCTKLKPNLVFLYSGGNDGYGINPLNVVSVINAFKAINCDVILCETYQPNTGSDTLNYYQEDVQDGIAYVRGFIVTYAQANGIPYLPFGRWGDIIRDGFDPEILSMPENNPTPGTAYAARWQPVPTSFLGTDGKTFTFPPIKNMLGVSADSCTDFQIGFTQSGIADGEAAWEIPLSDGINYGINNSFWVFFNDTNIVFKVDDGAGSEKTYNTNVPVPKTWWSAWIMVRGSRLVFAMAVDYNGSWEENSIGLGYTKLLDVLVPRMGGPFTPKIMAVNKSLDQFVINSLCTADTTNASGGGLRFKPSTNARALYYNTEIAATDALPEQPNAGGSDAYHMNNFGVRDLIYPVLHAQDWRAAKAQSGNVTTDKIISPSGYLQTDALASGNWIASSNWIKSAGSVTMFGVDAIGSQPTLTLTSPTANETAIANVLVSYGMVKLVSS